MKVINLLLLIFFASLSCKEKETSPIFTIVGTYRATVYGYGSSTAESYPIGDHQMSVRIVSASDSTVDVEIVSTPLKTALPENVFVPASAVYKDVVSRREGTPTQSAFYVNLSPIFGHPELLSNAILFYSGKNFADYYYTPAETPTVTRTIRLEREKQ
jgi:hypothetical protein